MTQWKEGDRALLPEELGGNEVEVLDWDWFGEEEYIKVRLRSHAATCLAIPPSRLLSGYDEPPERAVVLLTGGEKQAAAFQRILTHWCGELGRYTWAELNALARREGVRIVRLVEAPEQHQRKPRAWGSANDDDWLAPSDVFKVEDRHGDRWVRNDREWSSPGLASRVWGLLLYDFSPLTEVVEVPPCKPRVWTIENEDDHTEPANVRKVTDHEGDTWERGDEDWAWDEHCRPWRVLLGDHGPLTEVVV